MSDRKVINVVETELARAKLQEIRARFSEWLWSNPDRSARLSRVYNDTFNNWRLRVYDGGHLTLPGSSDQITLRPEQKNATWRVITSPTVMLALHPGWGKTYVMVASLMELRRLGLKQKGLIAVPNHLVAQFAAEFLQLYPTARVLMADVEDFSRANRTLFCARIATGDYDAIIIPHSAFTKLPLRPENEAIYLREQLEELNTLQSSIQIRGDTDGADRAHVRTVKRVENAKAKLQAKLEGLRQQIYPDDTVFLEDTGIDWLCVDEVHYFKNLPIQTKMSGVSGVPTSASARALDLAVKARWLFKTHKGGLVFSTGTPIANTLAEMYVWQLLLVPDALDERTQKHFDSWAGTWGEIVTQLELKPEGTGFRLNSRFAKFSNVPELAVLFNSFAEVRVLEDSDLPRPALTTGKAIVVGCPGSPSLKRFVKSLAVRARRIRGGLVPPREDNMLAVTGDGRKASLDMRLIDPAAKDFPESKINQCVRKVVEIYHAYAEQKGVQLIYCDLSTPDNAKFSVYRDVRDKLISAGLPAEEIAFIHDYTNNSDRMSLFRKMRDGVIRVLLASTEKGGTGMNVQKRLIAEHHLDVPWRPCDIEQREGRIIRFGNMFKEVMIFRWVTESSFDSYIWNLLCVKCSFINSIMRQKASQRVVFDVDNVILSYEKTRALATGDPRIVEKAGIDAKVMRLTVQANEHEHGRFRCRGSAQSLRAKNVESEKYLAALRSDASRIVPIDGDKFVMEIDGVTHTKREAAGEALLLRAKQMGNASLLKIGGFAGFELFLQKDRGMVQVALVGASTRSIPVHETAIGTIQAIQHRLRSFDEDMAHLEKNLPVWERQAGEYESEATREFPHARELAELLKRQAELNAELHTGPEDEAIVDGTEVDAIAA